ncbi:MAG: DUF6858 family protein [Sulfuricurvum sp.]|jgi:hypothetical protein
MIKTNFLDKYPVFSFEIAKSSTSLKSADEVLLALKAKVDEHKVATYIATFDHYSHTKKLGGAMLEGLLDAKNLIFCFGQAIPTTKILAVRPRSIGVSEFEDRFCIDFMEAPKDDLTIVMQKWIEELTI